jgi:erythronate-4-phosphate dehydrogenase
MKILADKNIPFLKGIAEHYGDVTYLAGADFTRENIREADTLIVRTVSRFDSSNLDGSNVKLICTATIGYDHIDTDYCARNGIAWRNAPGCNSGSVKQYIISALVSISRKQGFSLRGKTIGVIGVGHVGSKVAAACELLGMRVLKNDPPRQKAEPGETFVDIETIKREADIITFHVPLTREGEYPTFHMAGETFFASLAKQPIIINSARGGIVDTSAIKFAIRAGRISGAIIDCWEQEPAIDREYMNMVDIATPHIAGYSADGKANATRMSLLSLADYWSLPKEPISAISVPPAENPILDYRCFSGEDIPGDILLQSYDTLGDNQRLRAQPEQFSNLRGNYPLRREYGAYTVTHIPDTHPDKELLRRLGFEVR